MEKNLIERRRNNRPWWMTPFGREPSGDIWNDRLWPEWPRWQGGEFTPSFNLREKDGNYYLSGELPGVDKDDISIDVDKDLITVSGRKEGGKEEENDRYYFRETSYGTFSRSFRLPGDIDEEKVEASFKDGVLEMEIPLKESSQKKKIEIKS